MSRDSITRARLPLDLMEQVVAKMEADCFMRMYKTCSSMAASVERCLKKYNYQNFKIAHFEKITLKENVVEIAYMNRCRRRTQMKVERLPLSTLDSYVWKYIGCYNLHMPAETTAEKYLKVMQKSEPGLIKALYVKGKISAIARAMDILKPRMSKISDFEGDLHGIFPVLPFSSWLREGWGCVKYLEGTQFTDISKYLGDFEILEKDALPFLNEQSFKLKSSCGDRFIFTVSEDCMDLLKL